MSRSCGRNEAPNVQPNLFDRDSVPFQGTTWTSRSASQSGARQVVKTWASRQSAYLQALRAAGSLTDHEAAAITGYPLASICSVRNAKRVRAQIEPDGWDPVELEGGTTKRTKWRLKR